VLSAVVAGATVVVTAARILDRAFDFPANVHLAFSRPILITGVVALTGVYFCQIQLSYEAQRHAPSEGSRDQNPTYPQKSEVRIALAATVAGLICCPLAIVGWIVAERELKAIDTGQRDPAKRMTAITVRALAVAGLVLWPLALAANSFYPN
jgi:hypothetical protein